MEESAYNTFKAITSPLAVVGISILLVKRHGWMGITSIFICLIF